MRSYDSRGRLQTRTWARGVVTTYGYNQADEVRTVSYSDNMTPAVTLTRDERGRLLTQSDGAGSKTLAYAATGDLERETQSDGTTLSYQYDFVGRRVAYALWDGPRSQWATWGGWGYDGANGRISGISTPEGWIGYAYQGDYLSSASIVYNPPDGSNPKTTSTRWKRDSIGRLTEQSTFSQSSNSSTPAGLGAMRYSYDPTSQQLATVRLGNAVSTSGGEQFTEVSRWEYGYNDRNEVSRGIKKWANGTPVAGMQWGMDSGFVTPGYTYDAIGNRTQVVRNNYSPPYQTRSYNSLNQVSGGFNTSSVDILGETDSSATITIGSSSVVRQNNNTYFAGTVTGSNSYYPRWADVTVVEDKAGVLTGKTGKVLVPGPYPYLAYDFDGNQTADDMWTYTWDGENRLVKAETRWNVISGLPKQRLEFVYDAGGRRMRKKVSTSTNGTTWQQSKLTLFAYDGWNLIAEFEAEPEDVVLARTHHWGIDVSGTLTGAGGVGGLVLTRHHIPNGVHSYWPVMDNTGDVYALIDVGDGTVGASYQYGPFGEPLRASGYIASSNPIQWSTKYTDVETGLVNYGHRYYSIANGKWLGRDPRGIRAGSNLYVFVTNKTTCTIDYLGLTELLAGPELIQTGKLTDLDGEYPGAKPFTTLAANATKYINSRFAISGIKFPETQSLGTQRAENPKLEGVAAGSIVVGSHLFFVRWKLDSKDVKLEMSEKTQISRSSEPKPEPFVDNNNPVVNQINHALTQGTWISVDGSKTSCMDLIWMDSPAIAAFKRAIADRPAFDATETVLQTLTVKEKSTGRILNTSHFKIVVSIKNGKVTSGAEVQP